MFFKIPPKSDKYQWTQHSLKKMRYYGLTPQRVIRVIRSPERIEKGIADKTIAVMQPTSSRRNEKGQKTWKSEIWVMYQKLSSVKKKNKSGLLFSDPVKIISAWRYPGVSPTHNPIPEEILAELEETMEE